MHSRLFYMPSMFVYTSSDVLYFRFLYVLSFFICALFFFYMSSHFLYMPFPFFNMPSHYFCIYAFFFFLMLSRIFYVPSVALEILMQNPISSYNRSNFPYNQSPFP